MTDPASLADRYIALWNEPDAATRARLLARDWADDATYVDPLASANGKAEIGRLIEGVQARFPGFRFRVIGKPDGHGDYVRFSWTLGPGSADAPIEGTDFAILQDGRIASITGFLDRVPSPA